MSRQLGARLRMRMVRAAEEPGMRCSMEGRARLARQLSRRGALPRGKVPILRLRTGGLVVGVELLNVEFEG